MREQTIQENDAKNYIIKNELDVARVVLESSQLAKKIGFTASKQHLIATIVSELGRNILHHAKQGQVILYTIKKDNNTGIEILAKDEGPGIENIANAMKDHYSTKNSLGLGLPAVKRMSDEFTLETAIGKGTSIIAIKWLHHAKS